MKLLKLLRSRWYFFKKLLKINVSQNPTQIDVAVPIEKLKQYKKASLFPNGKANRAALSALMRGVAEVLSQKMNLPWKTETSNPILSYEQVNSNQAKICYYITDNPENPQPDTLVEETALNVIDQLDPRACAIHLIYCALATNLEKPWEETFIINDKQLLDYTGLVRRRDLSKHEQLTILYELVRQPAQILARVVWPKQGKIGAFTIADFKIWDITVLQDYQTDKAGNAKLVGLKVIGKAGAWAKYFLNKSEYHYSTGVITKKTVQKLFSIGKQNIGAARMLVWLTFQVQPGKRSSVTSKTLMEVAYGADKVSMVEEDRQKRRSLADDFETDLKVVKDAGWQVELKQHTIWLKSEKPSKRPIGYWKDLLNTTLHIQLPPDAQEYLALPENQHILNNLEDIPKPPTANLIREARKAKGLSRAAFAQRMGKSISWVDAIETGHRKVSQKDLPKIIDELELATESPLPP
jgi:DNA-binding XRE family transcriptional regulator